MTPAAPGRPAHPVRTSAWPSRPSPETLTAWAMVLPATLGFLLFYALPALRALQISFTDWNLLRPAHFIGIDNYLQLLHDARFWQGMKLALVYALLNIPAQTVLGLALAVAMQRLTQSLFVRAAVLLPYLLSNVLAAMVWLWLLDPALGLANHWIERIGAARQPFFSGDDQALASVVVVNIWRHLGLVAILFLAGLQNIPRSLYEAAALEGASEWQIFTRITLPLLRPVMVFVLVTSVTGALQVFDSVAVTTRGGPAGSTDVIVHYIVQSAFSYLKMGYASAMSVVLCAVMLVYTAVQMRVLRSDESDLR